MEEERPAGERAGRSVTRSTAADAEQDRRARATTEAAVCARPDTSDDATRVRFETIVREQTPRLVRTLTFVVLDRETAADIAQEPFMPLHSHWDTVSRHPHLDGWIYRVAINRAKDYRRSLARAARLVERIGREPVTTSPSEPWRPEFEFVQALRTLPKQQRVAAALYYAADLPLHEVAGIMGISEGAVKSHLHRARHALKDLVEEG